MSRSPYLDQEPSGVLILMPNKKWWLLRIALCFVLLPFPVFILTVFGLEYLARGTANFSMTIYIVLILQLALALFLLAGGILLVALLVSGGGGAILNESGVWHRGFKGKQGAGIEWKQVKAFELSAIRFSKFVACRFYGNSAAKLKMTFCQGPYHNINKAELVELLNRWREKFGGTSEAASSTDAR